MRTIQASAAKTHLLSLLDDVERGETIVITRRGRTVAEIVPRQDAAQKRAKQAMESILEIRKRTKPVSIEEILAWRDEGRR